MSTTSVTVRILDRQVVGTLRENTCHVNIAANAVYTDGIGFIIDPGSFGFDRVERIEVVSQVHTPLGTPTRYFATGNCPAPVEPTDGSTTTVELPSVKGGGIANWEGVSITFFDGQGSSTIIEKRRVVRDDAADPATLTLDRALSFSTGTSHLVWIENIPAIRVFTNATTEITGTYAAFMDLIVKAYGK